MEKSSLKALTSLGTPVWNSPSASKSSSCLDASGLVNLVIQLRFLLFSLSRNKYASSSLIQSYVSFFSFLHACKDTIVPSSLHFYLRRALCLKKLKKFPGLLGMQFSPTSRDSIYQPACQTKHSVIPAYSTSHEESTT